MSDEKGISWAWVTNNAPLTKGKSLFWGAVILTSADGGDASIYSGRDAASGRLAIILEGKANISNPVMFKKPLFMDDGIFVEIGSNVTGVLVCYE